MMYRLRWLRTLAPLLAVALLAILVGSQWQNWVQQRQQQRDIQDAVRSTAFRLTTDQWLEFDLQNAAVGLRVLTNAAVATTQPPGVDPERPRLGWRYRIDYELYDSHGKPLQTNEYHLRTQINDIRDPVSGENGLTWFDSSVAIPAETRTIQIPLDRLPRRAARLRLKLGDRDPEINEVVIRTYMKYERQGYDQPYMWSRLSVDRRQKLCRATVYPPELLSPQERRNLLRWNWAAIAPLGKQGRDYISLRIYQREAPQPRLQAMLPPEDSVICEPGVPLTFALPPRDGKVKLHLYPELGDAPARETQVEVKVFRPPYVAAETQTIVVSDLSEAMEFEVQEGGLLEVCADAYITCHAMWLGDETPLQEVSLSHDPPTYTVEQGIALPPTIDPLQAHVIDSTGSLSYAVAHVGENVTPFRVTVRRLWPVAESNPATVPDVDATTDHTLVNYEWLDSQDQIVGQGELSIAHEVARYDRGAIGGARMWISEPSTYYFAIPSQVARVRLKCDDGRTCAVAFTRPLNLARTFLVPEESDLYSRLEKSQRSWFLIRPEHFETRIERNEIVNLSIQTRPPEVNPEILEGDYTWLKFSPLGFTVGRNFLTRFESVAAIRPEVAPLLYYEASLCRPCPIELVPSFDGEETSPRLLYAWESSDASATQSLDRVRVLLDGKLWFEFLPRAQTGEIELPQLHGDSREQVLQIETARVGQCFLRGLRTAGDAYLKRYAHDLSAESIEFELIKESTEAETFVLRAFFVLDPDEREAIVDASRNGREPLIARPTDTVPVSSIRQAVSEPVGRRQIALDLLDIQGRSTSALRGWTLSHRVFDVAPDTSQLAIAVDGRPLYVDQGERCVFVLGEDLPPGKYRARLTLQGNNAIAARADTAVSEKAFVSVYRIHYGDRSLAPRD